MSDQNKVDVDAENAILRHMSRTEPIASVAILGLLFLTFGMQWKWRDQEIDHSGGFADSYLVDLGGLLQASVLDGRWDRIFTSNLLHSDFSQLAAIVLTLARLTGDAPMIVVASKHSPHTTTQVPGSSVMRVGVYKPVRAIRTAHAVVRGALTSTAAAPKSAGTWAPAPRVEVVIVSGVRSAVVSVNTPSVAHSETPRDSNLALVPASNIAALTA